MYYVVNSETGRIIDSSSKCPNPQEEADDFDCPVYIIEGQHTGLTAMPEIIKEENNAKRFD